MTRAAVLGGGSWGTALALILARRGVPVRLWIHNRELARKVALTRVNDTYLPGFPLPDGVQIETEVAAAVEHADFVVFATPSNALREVATQAAPCLPNSARLISAAKGIEEITLMRMSQVLKDVCGGCRIVALSGPSFAAEVARELPTALVAASVDGELARSVQKLFSGPKFRVYASTDLPGVELGGAVKNVIAIAAGVCQGLHLGQNAIAALITRGLAEISRLGIALGAQPQTLAGLSGLGDLVLTCTGDLSRNRQVGIQLASGKTVENITAGMTMVAEGIRTAKSVMDLGHRENVSLPICEQMHAVLYSNRPPQLAIQILMDRSLKGE